MGNKDVKDFMSYCGITATDSTLKKIEHKIKYIDNYFKGKLGGLNLKDVHDFLSYLNKQPYAVSSKNDFIKVLKRFLKWKYKDWSVRFNDLKDAKSNSRDQRQLSKKDLLTPEEMNIIVNSTDSLKYKTILLLFQETACRPEEILRKLKWRDVDFNSNEIKLYSSKTDKTRHIPINKSAAHLKRYREECFHTPPRSDDIIFPLSNNAVSDFLNKVERRLKFKKHLYMYLWRHSILTKMIQELSPKVYEMYSGHSLETGMKIYAHLDNDDLRKELDEKIYKIEKITKEDNKRLEILEKRVNEMLDDADENGFHIIINTDTLNNNPELVKQIPIEIKKGLENLKQK